MPEKFSSEKHFPNKNSENESAEELRELIKQLKKSHGITFSHVKSPSAFIKGIKARRRKINKKLIEDAFFFAKEKHAGQKRASGEPYFVHLYNTALILAQLGADSETVVAGLLHDILEDTSVSREEIIERFGEEIYSLIKALTKWHQLHLSKDAEAIHYLQKLLLSSTTDLRIVLIKLADKLHNARTLNHLPKPQQKRIAKLALQVYAPLAHKIGLHELENEMEDICFPIANPQAYAEIKPKVDGQRRRQGKILAVAKKTLQKEIKHAKKKFAFLTDVRSYHDVFHEMVDQGIDFNKIYDFVSLVILTDSVPECYEALYLVHKYFTPIPGSFFDYIAMPQLTYYSLHTTVAVPKAGCLKISIRTKEMDELTKRGILLWIDDKEKMRDYGLNKWNYLKKISRGEKAADFFESLKEDFLKDEINVFNSNGRVFSMPSHSTVIDFAYETSSLNAKRLRGATINAQPVPLWYTLSLGDTIGLFYDKEATVKKEWLDFISSPKAKRQIMHDLKLKAKKGRKIHKHPVTITVEAFDRKGLMAELCGVIFNSGFSLDFGSTRVHHKMVTNSFLFKIRNKKQAEEVKKKLEKVKNVTKVTID